MTEPDLPTEAIASIEQMLSEAIKGEPDWAFVADCARKVEAIAAELQT